MKFRIIEADYSPSMTNRILSAIASLKNGDLINSRALAVKVGTSLAYLRHSMNNPTLHPYRAHWQGRGNKLLWGNKRTIENYLKAPEYGSDAHL